MKPNGSAVRSTTHGISKENGAQQFHRDYLDFLAPNLHSECIKTKDERQLFVYPLFMMLKKPGIINAITGKINRSV